MIHLAYDGSLNGDWLAHYGIRLAAHHSERRLRVVSVLTASSVSLHERIDRLRSECESFSVELSVDVLDGGSGDVAETLLNNVPHGAGELLLCGARARPRNFALLSGTVSERLLHASHVMVVCIRVVNPGILGQPGRLLLPFAGHPRGAKALLTLLRLFDGDLTRLDLLAVEEAPARRLRRLEPDRLEELSRRVSQYVARIEAELREGLQPWSPPIHSRAVVADDAPHEIVTHANRVHARLIVLGASERTLPQRLLSASPIERVLRTAPADVAIYRDPR